MPDYARYGLIALIIFLTHFQEGVTGFGCTVLALPFIALLVGIKTAVPVLFLQAWVLTGYIVLIARKDIVWKEYWRILLIAGTGFPFGLILREKTPEVGLKWVLAAFMVLIGLQGMYRYYMRPKLKENGSRKMKWLSATLLPVGGFIHGAFGSGGPLIVIYATKVLKNKSLFRVTLCLVFFTLNCILTGQWFASAAPKAEVLRITAFCMPFTLVGMVIGNWAHHRMDELLFRRLVYTVLFLAGIALMLSVVLRVGK